MKNVHSAQMYDSSCKVYARLEAERFAVKTIEICSSFGAQ